MKTVTGYLGIADYFEARILSGKLKVNDRLPTTTELSKQFDVAPLTVQRGLKLLASKGLVTRKPRRGTIVCGSRDGSKRLAVMFGGDPFTLESPFYRLVLKAIALEGERSNVTIRPFYNIDPRLTHEFLTDLENRFSDGNVNCLLPLCGLPELDAWIADHENIACVTLPHYDIFQLACDGVAYLLDKGYRKIVTLSQYPVGDEKTEGALLECAGVKEAFEKFDLDPSGALPVQCGQSETAAHDYLSDYIESDGPPEAVLVLHDVNCRGVLAALTEKELKIKHDVAVVTHANKGAEFASPVKLTKLEVDPARIARDVIVHISENTLHAGENRLEKEYVAPLIEGCSA